MSGKSENIQCYIKTLRPVHIGTGDTFDIFSIYFDRENKQLSLLRSDDIVAVMRSQNSKLYDDLMTYLSGFEVKLVDIMKLWKEFQSVSNVKQMLKGLSVRNIKTAGEVLDRFDDITKIVSGGDINQFSIQTTLTNASDGRPYIPGSALKGSLWTGYLNYLNSKGMPELPQKSDTHLLSVSDFMPVGEVFSEIHVIKNIAGVKPGIPQMAEVIPAGAVFRGSITMRTDLLKTVMRNIEAVSNASLFYKELFKEQEGANNGVGMLFRVGKFCGKESYLKYRPLEKDKPKTHNRSSGLDDTKSISEMQRLGWIALEVINDGDNNNFTKAEDEFKRTQCERVNRLKQKRQSIYNELRVAAQKSAELAAIRRAEAERKELEDKLTQEAQAKRQAEIATLPKIERDILNLASMSSDDIKKAFTPLLDDYTGDDKKRIAQAIKDAFIRLNEWVGGSDKQKAKVLKIKNILEA